MTNPKTARPSRRAPSPSGRSSGRATAAVLLLALVPRVLHLLEYRKLPWFRVLQMDARFHADWAARLLQHGWRDGEPFFRAPLYPYLLALIQSVCGDLLWPARIFQLLLGVSTVVLAYRIAVRLLPPRWSLACGIALALQWSPIHHETELLLEPVLAFWSTLLLFLMVRAPEGRVGPGRLAGWGVLAGLAVITRPNFALFAPAIPVYAAALDAAQGRAEAGTFLRRWGGRLHRRGGALFLPFLAGFLFPILPVWVHNARCGDPGTPVAWQGGINLYIGNNPSSNGWTAVAPGMRSDWRGGFEDAIRLAQEGSGSASKLRPAQISDYWTKQAVRFWVDSPGAALRLAGRKLLFFWGRTEIKNNEDPGYFRDTLWSLRWLPVSFGLLAPAALLGLGLAWRRGRRFRLLAAFVLLWTLSILPFFICARYRLPVAVLLPLFALLGVRVLYQWWRERRWKALGPALLLIAGLGFLLTPDLSGSAAGGHFQSYLNLGDAWAELSRWPEAEAAYRRAIALNPKYVNSYNNLGQTLERMRRPAEAEKAYREGLDLQPAHPLIRRNLGLVLEGEGKTTEAEEIFAGLVRDYPSGWDSWFYLARIQESRMEGGPAVDSYRRGLALMPAATIPRAHLARLLARQGDSQEALGVLAAAPPGGVTPELAALRDSLGTGRGIRN
jgi:tetratricopeptide (TPR) repeat protein